MSQTLHIFRKDVQRFRYELCVLAALLGAFTISHAAASPTNPDLRNASALAPFTAVLLTLAWWFLISQLIHEEGLVGDRQFWVTRPYSWRHLLAAKVLFVLVFVNLPLLAAQMLILSAAGYPAFTGSPDLLRMQFAVAVVLLLPAFALSSVTRALGQFLFSILSAVLLAFVALAALQTTSFSVFGNTWPSQVVALLVASTAGVLVIRWQYSQRRTNLSWLVAGAALLLCIAIYTGMPRTLQDAIRSAVVHHSDARAVSVSVPPGTRFAVERSQQAADFIDLTLPVTIANVPAGAIARPQMTEVNLETSAGHWSSGWQQAWRTYPVSTTVGPKTEYAIHVLLPRDLFQRIRNTTIVLHGSMYLSIRRQTVVPLSAVASASLPDGGFCDVLVIENHKSAFCSAPFRAPFNSSGEAGVDIDRGTLGFYRRDSLQLLSDWDSPWPDFALSPVFTGQAPCTAPCDITLVREYPSAWITRDYRANVRMPSATEAKPSETKQ